MNQEEAIDALDVWERAIYEVILSAHLADVEAKEGGQQDAEYDKEVASIAC